MDQKYQVLYTVDCDTNYNLHYHKLTFQLNHEKISGNDYKLLLVPSSYDKYYQYPDGLYNHIISEIKSELEPLILTMDMTHTTKSPWYDINDGLTLKGSNKQYTIWYNKKLKNVFITVYI
jgi:hypothetical protein